MRFISARLPVATIQLALVLATAFAVPARAEDPPPSPIVMGMRYELASDVLGELRTVDVHLPANYASSFERCPVLIVLDPSQHFRHVAATTDLLARARAIPPMIVVGVHSTDRRRDLTPTEVQGFPDSGGADTFLNFLVDELVPWLDRRYRTAPYRVVVGESWGGLFGVHALIQRPDAIQGCIALEPRLGWGDGAVASALELALAERETWRASLHLARSGEQRKSTSHVDAALALAERDLPERFELSGRVHTEDSRGTLALTAVPAGLRTLYSMWPSKPVTIKTASLEKLTARSVELSEHFGYAIPVPESDMNTLGYRLLGLDRIEDAVAVFERNATTWPESANVYDSLGDALDRAGDPERALANYSEACRLARAQNHPYLDAYLQNRDRLQQVVASRR